MRAAIAALVPVLLFATFSIASPDVPLAGRSLFDQLTIVEAGGQFVQRIPYPFEALLHALEKRAGTDALGRPGIAAVLIPLGRSLQRNASPDRPFDHPRVVAAVTGEPRQSVSGQVPLLKDRLFLGFQDEAGVIEVISYNETAGRFEFQVVKDYRAGRDPKVFYANRTVCTACHHNAAPIFSRPSWDETNANPSIARALVARAPAFHGVQVARGVDVPNAIDDAVARANRISWVQTLWRDGCARVTQGSDPLDCRRAALAAALKVRLSASGTVDLASPQARTELFLPLSRAWKTRWPAGLAEPDPNISNRDPYFGESQRIVQSPQAPWGAYEITPSVDPLALRSPLAIWHGDAEGIGHFIRSLASLLATADLDALDRWVQRMPGGVKVPRDRVELQCQSVAAGAHRNLRCTGTSAVAGSASLEGSFRLDGARAMGTIARLHFATLSLRDIALTPTVIERRGLERRVQFQPATRGAAARLADGRALDTLELAWTESADAAYRGLAVLKNEFAALEPALAAIADATRSGHVDVLADLPFRRAAVVRALFAQLGIEGDPPCCAQNPALPPPRAEPDEGVRVRNVSTALRPFYQHCGACHAASDASPPGFLHGDLTDVERSLTRCAARIQYRLDMWRVAPARRSKVPMPPPSIASNWEFAPPADDLALMQGHIARLQKSTVPAAVADQAYESLPPCRLHIPMSGANPPYRPSPTTISKQGVIR